MTTARKAAPSKKAKPKKVTKLFVIDTNVFLHDPSSIFRFEEHDVYVPMMTLEELDNHKTGMTEVARNARQITRTIDEIVDDNTDIQTGIDLKIPSHGLATGKLVLQTEAIMAILPAGLPTHKGDNQILAVTLHLVKKHEKRPVVLVSKDINMRIKARALGLQAEDYFNDQVLEDTDLLYSGSRELPKDFWDTHGKDMESWKKEARTYYRINGPLCKDFLVNEFVFIDGDQHFSAQVKEVQGKTALLETLIDYSNPKNAVWGITARNREQNLALNALLNPEIDFVSLMGQAGTGKTLLTLAAGLHMTFDEKLFAEIIVTRATVPVGQDIGFLPGGEEEKLTPWFGALDDCLEVLTNKSEEAGPWGKAATDDLIKSKLKIKSMGFMRGRTFINKFLIIDEAQNLTPKEMKTLVTRAGNGTKVVVMGNLAQIDTPYVTEGSSGLTYAVDRFKGWAHHGHVTLQKGERSRLSIYAAEVL